MDETMDETIEKFAKDYFPLDFKLEDKTTVGNAIVFAKQYAFILSLDEREPIRQLKEAISEIERLRRQNELMRARLDMFDAMNAILYTQVDSRKGGSMSPDCLGTLKKYIASKAD
jgi:hypothetical protein